MAKVDPFQHPIPRGIDPALFQYLTNLDRFLKDLWERTGGSDDLVERSDVRLAADVMRSHDHEMTDIRNLHYGAGVPSAALGKNGDFYLRNDGSAGTFIYHKATGTWTAFA